MCSVTPPHAQLWGPQPGYSKPQPRNIRVELHQAGSACGRQGRQRAHVLLMKPSPQHMAVLPPAWPFPSMRNSVVELTCARQQRLSRRASARPAAHCAQVMELSCAVHLGVWPPLTTAKAAGSFHMSARNSRGSAWEIPPHNPSSMYIS